MNHTPASRLAGLDALRGFAMLLGLYLHSSIPFLLFPLSTWPVRDSRTGMWADAGVYASHSFRLQVFFTLSGFLAYVVIRRRGAAHFVRHRFKRILLPFLAALVIIVPMVQAFSLYEETREQQYTLKHPGTKVESRTYFYPLNPTDAAKPMSELFKTNFLSEKLFLNLVPMHLWFLYYLFLISLALAFLPFQLPATLLKPHWMTLGVTLFLLPMRTWTADNVADWNFAPRIFAYYGFFFLLGRALAHHFQNDIGPWRAHWKKKLLLAHAVALPGCGLLTIWLLPLAETGRGDTVPGFLFYRIVTLVCQAAYTTLCVQGLFGCFNHYFQRPSRAISYASQAAYFFYLVSPVPILAVQLLTQSLEIPGPVKFVLVLLVSTLIIEVLYEAFVRRTPIGAFLGVKQGHEK